VPGIWQYKEVQLSECVPKPFLCKVCKFVLGFVESNEEGIDYLNVLRWAVPHKDWPPQADVHQLVAARIADGNVLCSHCGAKRPYKLSGQQLESLVRQRRIAKGGKES